MATIVRFTDGIIGERLLSWKILAPSWKNHGPSWNRDILSAWTKYEPKINSKNTLYFQKEIERLY